MNLSILALSLRYELRIVCYRYNSGSADNGYFTEVMRFDDEGAARKIFEEVTSDAMKGGSATFGGGEFVDEHFCYPGGGFIERVEGLFKIETSESETRLA